jgi:cell division protein FtsA
VVDRTIVGIDIGTTKVCTLVGEVDEQDILRVVGVGTVPAQGMRKGVIVNVAEASQAIAASVEKAERISGYDIERANVSLAGAHVSSINSRGVVAVQRGERGINQDDIDRALDAARTIAIPHDREIVHVIPRDYAVDGQEGIKDPQGMIGYRLEVEAHIITGATSSIHNLIKCVEDAGVGVDELVLDPLASGLAVLSDNERELGVVLADIGGGTTDIAIFIEGSIWHTTILGVGGNHLTNDIAVCLKMPALSAEEAKLKYGHACPDMVDPNDMVSVQTFGENSTTRVARRELAQVIEARVEEILGLILQEIKRSGYDGLLPAGVVLCGGTSELRGIRELGRRTLGLPVRVGTPHDLQGLVDTISSPAFATSAGLLQWGQRQAGPANKRSRRTGSEGGLKLMSWLKNLLPDRG